MKLWHDDTRDAPDDTWTVARTNEEALNLLEGGNVEEASLDFQLCFPENGLELALEMVRRELVPPKVTCHSLSYDGARSMADVLSEGGCPDVRIEAALW